MPTTNNIIDVANNFTIVANNFFNPTYYVTQNSTITMASNGYSAFSNSGSFSPNTGTGYGSSMKANWDSVKFNVADNWTVESWIFSNGLPIGSTTTQWLWNLTNDTGTPYMGIYLTKSGGIWNTLNFQTSGIFASLSSLATNSNVVPQNRWTHIATVYDKTASQLRLYVDGIFRAQTSSSVGTVTNPTSANLFIGGSGPLDVVQKNWFSGYMDDFIISSVVKYAQNQVANSTPYVTPNTPYIAFPVINANSVIVTSNVGAFSTTKANDLIVIDTNNTLRTQIKVIKNVINSSTILIESSTQFLGDGRLTVQTGNIYAAVSGNTSQLSILANDIVQFNSSSNLSSMQILEVNGNVLKFNTAAVSSNTNLLYLVYPSYQNVSYKIITT